MCVYDMCSNFRFLRFITQNQKKQEEKICPEEEKDPRVEVSSEGEEVGLIKFYVSR